MSDGNKKIYQNFTIDSDMVTINNDLKIHGSVYFNNLKQCNYAYK